MDTNKTLETPSASNRFTEMILREFCASVGDAPNWTNKRRRLAQGYFVCIDRALAAAEMERIRKNGSNRDHKFDNDLPCVWQNVNMTDLALDVTYYIKMGLDMQQPNMLFPIPFKNNKTQKYDITMMEGYNGLRYIGTKYALDPPLCVTTEVVYSTDRFVPIKKGYGNTVEDYQFEIKCPFERGDIIGGFIYIEYEDRKKNKLIVMSIREIMKRKPKYASENFWGGSMASHKDGKKNMEEIDGWLDKMVLKTLIREAYGPANMPRDPDKMDDAYRHMQERKFRYAEIVAEQEIEENANKAVLDFDDSEACLPPPPKSVKIKPTHNAGDAVSVGCESDADAQLDPGW